MAKEDYKGMWVFAEQEHGVIEGTVFELLAKAKDLQKHNKEELVAVLLGYGVEGLASEYVNDVVSAIYEVDQVEDEIRKRAGSQMVNEYWWEESVKERVRFLVVEDDQGNKVGALTGIKNGPSVKTGDRIWMKGRSRDLGEDETMLPRYFLECDVVPPYYIFR